MVQALVGMFQSLVALLSGLFAQMQVVPVYEVWNTPKGGALAKFSDAPSKAKADEVATALKVLGGTAEVRGPVNKVVLANTKNAEPTWDDIKKVLAAHEGDIPYMYLDSNGYVTVAIGNLLSSAADAQKLKFVNRTTGKDATAAEIKTDFDEVSKQTANKVASYYKKYTKLDMPAADRLALFQTRIDGFVTELQGQFPDYDSYPIRVKAALLDMAFNLGTDGVVKKFPTFTAAIKAKDWTKAAGASHRKAPVSEARNSTVKQWLEDQARADKDAAAKKN